MPHPNIIQSFKFPSLHKVRLLDALKGYVGEGAFLRLMSAQDNFNANAVGRAAANCHTAVLQWLLNFISNIDASLRPRANLLLMVSASK